MSQTQNLDVAIRRKPIPWLWPISKVWKTMLGYDMTSEFESLKIVFDCPSEPNKIYFGDLISFYLNQLRPYENWSHKNQLRQQLR